MKTLLALLALLVISCDASNIIKNEGSLCVFTPNNQTTNKTPVTFHITQENCSCTQAQEKSCEVHKFGRRLTINSAFRYEPLEPGLTCLDVCITDSVSCESEPLEPGSYRVHHGNDSYEIQLPSNDCFEEP